MKILQQFTVLLYINRVTNNSYVYKNKIKRVQRSILQKKKKEKEKEANKQWELNKLKHCSYYYSFKHLLFLYIETMIDMM